VNKGVLVAVLLPLLFAGIHVPVVAAQPVEGVLLADAFVVSRPQQADANFGTSSNLNVRRAVGWETIGYLQFALDAITVAPETITTATLQLHTSYVTEQFAISVHHSPNVTWHETTITWNTRPAYNVTGVAVTVSTVNTWYNWTAGLASFVRNALHTAHQRVTFVVTSVDLHDVEAWVDFHSQDHAEPQYRPRLIVELNEGAGQTATTISCGVTPAQVAANGRVFTSGSISPEVASATVTLTYTRPNGSTVTQTTMTDLDGSYSATYDPSVEGEWTAHASWPGNDSYTGATSAPFTFSVLDEPTTTKIPTNMTCWTYDTEYEMYDRVWVRGRITDRNGTLIALFTDVNFTVVEPGGKTVVHSIHHVGREGEETGYRISVYLNVPGEWRFNASWSGNSVYEGARADTYLEVEWPEGTTWQYCFIATATYGSSVAPEVQFLRDFRADTVLTTFTGQQFMAVFNGIYYRFSPTVASGIARSEGTRTVMQGVLYPLVRILQVGEWVTLGFTVNPELGIVAFVLTVSALLSLIYLVPWALLLSYGRRLVVSAEIIRGGGYLLAGSVGLLLLAIALQMPVVTMVGGAMTVLVTTGLTTLAVTRIIMRRLITP
jgi:hypothetical protein